MIDTNDFNIFREVVIAVKTVEKPEDAAEGSFGSDVVHPFIQPPSDNDQTNFKLVQVVCCHALTSLLRISYLCGEYSSGISYCRLLNVLIHVFEALIVRIIGIPITDSWSLGKPTKLLPLRFLHPDQNREEQWLFLE